jgi:hypothetical protein
MFVKKHIPFKYKQIGVFIFLLLNCFLTTLPFIKAVAENGQYAVTAAFTSQSGSLQEPEEDSRSIFPEEQQQYHIAVRSKQGVVHVLNKTRPYAALGNNSKDDSALYHSFTSALVVVRPAYYIFLSLYKLF